MSCFVQAFGGNLEPGGGWCTRGLAQPGEPDTKLPSERWSQQLPAVCLIPELKLRQLDNIRLAVIQLPREKIVRPDWDDWRSWEEAWARIMAPNLTWDLVIRDLHRMNISQSPAHRLKNQRRGQFEVFLYKWSLVYWVVDDIDRQLFVTTNHNFEYVTLFRDREMNVFWLVSVARNCLNILTWLPGRRAVVRRRSYHIMPAYFLRFYILPGNLEKRR